MKKLQNQIILFHENGYIHQKNKIFSPLYLFEVSPIAISINKYSYLYFWQHLFERNVANEILIYF